MKPYCTGRKPIIHRLLRKGLLPGLLLVLALGFAPLKKAQACEGLACPPVCGNGILENGEECDDGNVVSGDGCSATCDKEFPICGNGKTEGTEQCDDGNLSDTDACLNNCQLAKCGDGFVRAGFEECDDGNLINGDGCSSTCTVEQPVCGNGILENGEECDNGKQCSDGTTDCTNDPSVCGDGSCAVRSGDGCNTTCDIEAPFCGNGILDAGEECDDGNLDSRDGCSSNCKICGVCGNGVLEEGEACDDGNKVNGDGCSSNCTIEVEGTVSKCGNGIKEGNEECDDGNTNDHDDCLSNCTLAKCGDNIIQTSSANPANIEECDDGANNANDHNCMNNCKLNVCGDGFINHQINPATGEQAEACDDGNNTDFDGCSSDCQACPQVVCGDGIPEGSETCDDGNTTSGDGCSSTCQIETAGGVCGDGTVTPPEECDDGAKNGTAGDPCSISCQNQTSGAVCGNGELEGDETCDDGNTKSGDGCSSSCQIEGQGAVCGNGILEFGEECDDVNNEDCVNCMIVPETLKCGDEGPDHKLHKVLVCHNPNNPHTICVDFHAWVKAHDQHQGDFDTLGSCPGDDSSGRITQANEPTSGASAGCSLTRTSTSQPGYFLWFFLATLAPFFIRRAHGVRRD